MPSKSSNQNINFIKTSHSLQKQTPDIVPVKKFFESSASVESQPYGI